MRKFTLCLVGCLIPLLEGCPSATTPAAKDAGVKDAGAKGPARPRDLIIGVWESTDPKMKGTQEFKADGVVIVVMDEVKMNGKYKFIEDELMEVEIDPGQGAPKMTQKLKVKVDKDELTTTDEKNQTDRMKRKK